MSATEVLAFIRNYTTATPIHGIEITRMEVAHNNLLVLRQLAEDAVKREQQLVDALTTCMKFAAMRRRELGSLSPEMEAVDAQARGVLAGNPHPAGTLAHDVWMRGYTGKDFTGHEGSEAHGWYTEGAKAKYEQQCTRGQKA